MPFSTQKPPPAPPEPENFSTCCCNLSKQSFIAFLPTPDFAISIKYKFNPVPLTLYWCPNRPANAAIPVIIDISSTAQNEAAYTHRHNFSNFVPAGGYGNFSSFKSKLKKSFSNLDFSWICFSLSCINFSFTFIAVNLFISGFAPATFSDSTCDRAFAIVRFE